jgi:NCAIR mutase (PurE)-related protein
MRRNAGESSERNKDMKIIREWRTGVREIVYCEGEVGKE